jgi:hypothetical protein
MKYILVLIIVMLSSIGHATEEKMCWVTFDYGGKSTNGPGGQGIDLTTTEDPFVYKVCKKICYDHLTTKYENIKGVKSCAIGAIPIEESKYRNVYLQSKQNICHVQVEGKYTYYVKLAKGISECEKIQEECIWCKQGSTCSYTYGQW